MSRLTFKRDKREALSRDTAKSNGRIDRESLQQEIVGLQALGSQMTSRIADLRRRRETAAFTDSFRGKFLGRTWAVYCVCRVCSVTSDPSNMAALLTRL